MFVTLQHEHSDRPFDSMNLWLEDVGKNEFYVCMRELMTFDGIHSDLKVVSRREWWGRSILKIWFRGIAFNKRADSIAHSQLFYLFIFFKFIYLSASPCHLFLIILLFVSFCFPGLFSIGLLIMSSLPIGTLRNEERLISLDTELHCEKIITPFAR